MTFAFMGIFYCKICPHCIYKFSLDDYDDGGGLSHGEVEDPLFQFIGTIRI